MELIYTDKNKKEEGALLDYYLDLAYGENENDFALEVPLYDHCCEQDFTIYIEGTEYGGIIDCVEPNTEKKTVTYSGRSWHGIMESKIIEPEKGQDYLTLYGDANEVVNQLIEKMDLQDIFVVSPELSGLEIYGYQMRYGKGYTAIRKMLENVDGKLRMEFLDGYVKLKAIPFIDYSQDEEFDASQTEFTLKKTYNHINHIICAGQGELAERYIIHIYADENGGIQPYAKVENPLQDSDYILDKSSQVLFGTDNLEEFYDYGSAGVTENYILLTTQPVDWVKSPGKYYEYNEDTNRYDPLKEDDGDIYIILSEEPADWEEQYSSYYMSNGMGGYKSVEGASKDVYKRLAKKPPYWDKTYNTYYYYYTDGVVSEYRSVQGVTKEYYKLQTRKPTDWKDSFNSYYKRKKKGGYETVQGTGKKKKKAPAWKAKKYYTKMTTTKIPAFKTTYYSKTTTASTPAFASGKYYEREAKYKTPPFVAKKYYQKVLDHYAVMVEKAVEKLKKYAFDSDKISIDFRGNYEKVYDVGDIVGGADPITGIELWQPITKKIIKIENNKKETITYMVGSGEEI